MAILHELRSHARHIAPPVIGAAVFAYFAYHAVQGERGLLTWLRLSQQIREAEATYAGVAEERARLEHRVALLSPGSLDPDMLEERARAMLNLAHSDDLVIFLEPPPAGRPGTRK
jgi:cell division protein FtsB